MRVWRVECPKGIGAYKLEYENGDYVLGDEFAVYTDKHPHPLDDRKLRSWANREDYQEYVFAFENEQHLDDWFLPAMRVQLRPRARISIYETDDYILGEKQCVFRRRTATLIERLPL